MIEHYDIGLWFPETDDEILALNLEDGFRSVCDRLQEIRTIMRKNHVPYTIYYDRNNVDAFVEKIKVLDSEIYLSSAISQLYSLIGKCSVDISKAKLYRKECRYLWININSNPVAFEVKDLLKVIADCEMARRPNTYLLSFKADDDFGRDTVPIFIDAIQLSEMPQLANVQYCHPASTFIEILDADIDKRSFSLRDVTKFLRTNYTYRPTRQRIYQNIDTNDYWYFDFYHRENKKHYEVFNSTDYKHVGEADMEGNIIPGSKEKDKSIRKYIVGQN